MREKATVVEPTKATVVEPTEGSEADLLHGIAAIGQALGITARQAKYRADQKQIPTFKIGRIVCARRSSLREWLDGLSRRPIEPSHSKS